MKRRRVRFGQIARLILTVVFFCAAPTAGDIGSCSQSEDDLSAVTFFNDKKELDCSACQRCGILTNACADACASTAPEPSTFPDHCVPLVHDGEVCLDALSVASCEAYSLYMADQGATVPSECDFCPAMTP